MMNAITSQTMIATLTRVAVMRDAQRRAGVISTQIEAAVTDDPRTAVIDAQTAGIHAQTEAGISDQREAAMRENQTRAVIASPTRPGVTNALTRAGATSTLTRVVIDSLIRVASAQIRNGLAERLIRAATTRSQRDLGVTNAQMTAGVTSTLTRVAIDTRIRAAIDSPTRVTSALLESGLVRERQTRVAMTNCPREVAVTENQTSHAATITLTEAAVTNGQRKAVTRESQERAATDTLTRVESAPTKSGTADTLIEVAATRSPGEAVMIKSRVNHGVTAALTEVSVITAQMMTILTSGLRSPLVTRRKVRLLIHIPSQTIKQSHATKLNPNAMNPRSATRSQELRLTTARSIS